MKENNIEEPKISENKNSDPEMISSNSKVIITSTGVPIMTITPPCIYKKLTN